MAAPAWTRRDAFWEGLQEGGCHAWLHGRRWRALVLWRLAWVCARLCFDRRDPRRAACLATAALVARRAGREALAQRRLAAALEVWSRAPAWVERMHIARRARTSLQHLRLELQNWPVYEANLRRRMAGFAAEMEASLRALQAGEGLAHRHFSRWRGEKPPQRDDIRRFLGACLLLADMLDGEGRGEGRGGRVI